MFHPTLAHAPTSATTAAAVQQRGVRQWLAAGAVVGPILFTLAWIVLGIFQPPVQTMYGVLGGISGAISNPISGLGVGPNAAVFNTAFVVCGLVQFVGIIATLRILSGAARPGLRRASEILLGASPIGLAMAGIFTIGAAVLLHLVAATLLFVAPVGGFITAGLLLRNFPRYRGVGNLLIASGPLTLVLYVAYVMTFDVAATAAGLGVAGLTERLLMLEIHAWYVVLGVLALRVAQQTVSSRDDRH